MSIFKDFKSFAMKGNVVDLAVGIIIGAAFGKIVSSFVTDVLMPPLGLMLGGIDFGQFALTLKPAVVGKDAVLLYYGKFINTLIDFVIVAFAIFLMIKGLNSLKKQEAAAPAAPTAPSKEETLLAEIRDILKSKN